LDVYDTQTRLGTPVYTLDEERGYTGPVFDPVTGGLFTCDSTGYALWQPVTGSLVRRGTWRIGTAGQRFIGFSPQGRLALTKATAEALRAPWCDSRIPA
jgi:hypothetical protein